MIDRGFGGNPKTKAIRGGIRAPNRVPGIFPGILLRNGFHHYIWTDPDSDPLRSPLRIRVHLRKQTATTSTNLLKIAVCIIIIFGGVFGIEYMDITYLHSSINHNAVRCLFQG